MADPQRKVKGYRVLGVFGLCALMSPIWHVALFRQIQPTEVWSSYLLELLPFFAGSILVGAVFSGVALRRGRTPSIYFSILVPAIGALGVEIVAQSFVIPYRISSFGQVLDDYVFMLLLAYFLVGFITIPLSILQTLLMRCILRDEVREERIENAGLSTGAISESR